MKLSLSSHPGHGRRQEPVAAVDNLVASTAKRLEGLTAVIGRVIVDVMPVERLHLAASFASFGLDVEAVRLPASSMRVLGLLPGARLLGYSKMSPADRFLHMVRPSSASDRVAVSLRFAVHAVSRVARDRFTAVGARLAAIAVLASRSDAPRPIAAFWKRRQRLFFSAFAAFSRHNRILQECHPPVMDGQIDIFDNDFGDAA
jgi:hypothetical protein